MPVHKPADDTPAAVVASGLMLPETKITITNPTPVVETAEEEREEEPVSYHVENAGFSMSMSSDQIVKYNSQAPVEIAVTCEDPDPPTESQTEEKTCKEQEDSACLTFTEIMVTAPTPRTQSPIEEQITFTQAAPEGSSVTEEPEQKEPLDPIEEPKQPLEPIVEPKKSAVEPVASDDGWANFQVHLHIYLGYVYDNESIILSSE